MEINSLTDNPNDLLHLTSEIARREPGAISLLNRVYEGLFNATIQQGCGNCYQKAFFRIQKYLYTNKLNNMKVDNSNRKYVLKDGIQLQTEFGGDTLTNDNLTDKAAESLLKKNPTLAKHFARLPGDEKDDSKKPLTAPQIKSFVEGLAGDEKTAFLTAVKEAIEKKEVLTINIEDVDRELTVKQLESIDKANKSE